MFTCERHIQRVQFVSPYSPRYRQHRQQIRDAHPTHGGPRNPGERIGGMIERAARFWLSQHVALDEDRILSWREDNARSTRYQELDALQRVSDKEVCLFEVKLTTAAAMQRTSGISQLNAAAEVLSASTDRRAVRRRLVCVAEAPQAVGRRQGMPWAFPGEMGEELAVIWVPPAEIIAAAKTLGLCLPAGWLDPQTRRCVECLPVGSGTTSLPFNPLAAAMERALAKTANP